MFLHYVDFLCSFSSSTRLTIWSRRNHFRLCVMTDLFSLLTLTMWMYNKIRTLEELQWQRSSFSFFISAMNLVYLFGGFMLLLCFILCRIFESIYGFMYTHFTIGIYVFFVNLETYAHSTCIWYWLVDLTMFSLTFSLVSWFVYDNDKTWNILDILFFLML